MAISKKKHTLVELLTIKKIYTASSQNSHNVFFSGGSLGGDLA